MITRSRGYFRKRFIKLALLILTFIILALGVMYVWFVHNSKRLLIDLVNEKSSGRLKLDLAGVTFNFTNSVVKIRKAKIASTNKDNGPVGYQVSFTKITLHTNSIWSLLITQSLEIL